MIDSVIYFSQAALKMKWCHVGQVLNTHNASGGAVEKGVWVSGCAGPRGGNPLASQSEQVVGGGRVFLSVG